MVKIISYIIFLTVGVVAGFGVDLLLNPIDAGNESSEAIVEEVESEIDIPQSEKEFVKMGNQFVVPIIKNDEVVALTVLSLSLEVEAGTQDSVLEQEPKLRNDFLSVLFDFAHLGRFDGTFTDVNTLNSLRAALHSVAKTSIGKHVTDVLILEIARQDV